MRSSSSTHTQKLKHLFSCVGLFFALYHNQHFGCSSIMWTTHRMSCLAFSKPLGEVEDVRKWVQTKKTHKPNELKKQVSANCLISPLVVIIFAFVLFPGNSDIFRILYNSLVLAYSKYLLTFGWEKMGIPDPTTRTRVRDRLWTVDRSHTHECMYAPVLHAPWLIENDHVVVRLICPSISSFMLLDLVSTVRLS